MELERNVRIQKKIGEAFSHEEKSALKAELIGKYLKKQREDPNSAPGELMTDRERKELKRIEKREKKKHKKKKKQSRKGSRSRRSCIPASELPAQYANCSNSPSQYAGPTADEILEANLCDSGSERDGRRGSRGRADHRDTNSRESHSYRERGREKESHRCGPRGYDRDRENMGDYSRERNRGQFDDRGHSHRRSYSYGSSDRYHKDTYRGRRNDRW